VTGKSAGRPRIDTGGELKATIFSIRLSPAERAEIEAVAKSSGQKASDWARGIILAAAHAMKDKR
jgi:hypothetical protein